MLVDSIRERFKDRSDYSVGGRICFFYDINQLKNRIVFRPDFYFFNGISVPTPKFWAVWDHGGRYPDVVLELLTPETRERDRTERKEIYRTTFRTSEYFLYDPETQQLEGYRHDGQRNYDPIPPDSRP